MKFFTRWTIGLVLLFASQTAVGQFYAPDTEYHDPLQRVYVVEAARVLGWLSDIEGTNIAEVTYQLTTKEDRTVSWQLHWLDREGKQTKLATVSYPEADLKTGPEFYRTVFKQLCLAVEPKLMPLTADEVRQSFWKGAGELAPSREQSLERVIGIVSQRRPRDYRWQPELAGLLSHCSLAGTADRTALDWVVLARGAAWLALCEQACSTTMDDLWSPILFQAGRERKAAELWNKVRPTNLEKATPAERGWNIWLRKPASRDVYRFAAGSISNMPMAMPMLVYDAVVNDSGRLLGDLFPILVSSGQSARHYHNYAPFLATSTSVGGGRLMEGTWPIYARAEWLKLLSAYAPRPLEYQGYTNLLQKAEQLKMPSKQLEENEDPSLAGLRELAPLFKLARTEGIGSLSPTPAVTSRDILNYGFEMTGLQMGSRYSFVTYHWGVPELAKPIFAITTGEIEGLMPFFKREQDANTYNYRECLVRLQMVNGFFYRVGFSNPPFDSKVSPLETARLFIKRWWLRPCDFEWQARYLFDANAVSEMPELMNSLQSEGGTFAAIEMLHYLDKLGKDVSFVPRGPELRYELAETLPQPTRLYVRCVYDRKFRGLGNLQQGEEFEKLYWKNPDCGMEDRVFRYYAAAGALKSARRFYLQSRTNIIDQVEFSNRGGLIAFEIAHILQDAQMRRMVLEDSSSGSFNDMCLHIWDAAVEDDRDALKKDVQELIERYESQKGPDSRGRMLLRFLGMLPALGDAQHPDHQKALAYFGRDDGWLMLRWFWIERFHLKAQDAVTFLGGRETDRARRVLICYLDRDAQAMGDSLNQFNASRNSIDEFTILFMHLFRQLHPPANIEEAPDLKPPDSESVRQIVLSKKGDTH